MSSEQGEQQEEIGTKAWFATIVKLPCGGLDPSQNCNHVSDEEIIAMFGEKLKYRGYQYSEAKAVDVKAIFEELYPMFYQSKRMPRDGFVTESFVQAVLSKVCRHNRMNWALFASERWAHKKSVHKNSDLVLIYKEEDLTKTYDKNILQALKRATDEEAQQLGNLQIELEKTIAMTKELEGRSTHHPFGETEEVKQLELKAQKLKDIIKIRGDLLKIHEGSVEAEQLSNKDAMVEYHKSMISAKEENILKLTKELNPLKSQLKQIKLPNEEMGKAKKEVMRLTRLKQSLLDSISKDKEFIQNLEMIVELSDETQHPCFPDNTVGEREVTLTILACTLCKRPFPKLDVLVAPCHCAYHPWCGVRQNWRSGSVQ